MALNEQAKQLAEGMARRHDELLVAQLVAHGVPEPIDMAALQGRLVRVVYIDCVIQWKLDGVVIITFYPVELTHVDGQLTATQRYLLPTGTEAPNER